MNGLSIPGSDAFVLALEGQYQVVVMSAIDSVHIIFVYQGFLPNVAEGW